MILRILAAIVLLLAVSATAEAGEKLKVMLDWLPNPDEAPLFAADYSGAFARQGLDVEMIAPSDPNSPPLLLAAGQVDIAISYQPQLYLMAEKSLPVVRIGTLVDTPLNSVMAIEGPVKTLADLKGRTIGYSISGTEEALLAAMLDSAGLAPSDVTEVNVNFQIMTALLSGRVDATISAYRNKEVNELASRGKIPVVFFPEEHGVPAYDELIYLARKDAAASPKIWRFLSAAREGTLYLLNHPDEVWAKFVAAHPDQDTPLVKLEWTDSLRRFAKNPMRLDRGRYEEFATFMAAHKQIAKVPALADYATELCGPGAACGAL